MNTAEVCANCEEPVLGQPVFFDGGVYCCTGCIAGGPCVCTYQAPAAHAERVVPPAAAAPVYRAPAPAYSAPISAATAYAASIYRAPSPLAATPQPGREPIPFPGRDNGPRAIVLRLGGFRDQRDLLEFALILEDAGVLAEVSLTRAEPADAWFAVRAASAQQVVAALQEVRGWLISASASESYVEGRVESVPAEVTEPEPVLPQRPRFRVFSPRPAETPPGAVSSAARTTAQTAAAVQEQPAYQEPAAYQEPEVARPASAPVRPVYTAPPVPVLPIPVRPAPVPQPQRFVQPSQPVLPVLPAAAAPVSAPRTALVAQPHAVEPAPVTVAAPAAVASIAPLPAPAPVPASAAPAAPAPRPAAAVASRQPDMIAADDRPGGAVPLVEHLTLVVYPFHSFVALNEFQGAIRALRGVTNTRVRRFYRGTLHLAVDYEDIIPLAERLQDLRGFRWQMVSESRQEIELLLEDTGALMAAEGDG